MLKQKEVKLHALMCLIGGFAGTYSLLRCHDNFGAAQTANLILVIEALIGADWREMILRMLGLAAYMAGIFTYILVVHRTHWDPRKWLLTTESICMLCIGLLPERLNFFICLYPIFFMLAAQWSVFHGICDYNASTIFSSNNVKQFTLAAGEYLLSRDKKQAEKARFFGMTLLSYHAGVLISMCCYQAASHFSIWFGLIPVTLAAWMISHPQEEKKQHPAVPFRAKLS